MGRPAWTVPLLAALGLLAAGSLTWGSYHALRDSADLMQRAEEVNLFVQGHDPYQDPDLTYPPSALPVFTALIAPFARVPVPALVRLVWLGLNLTALGVACGLILALRGRSWSWDRKAAFVLVVAASKPVRLAIGMGQYALLPLTLMLAAVWALQRKRDGLAGVLTGLALVKPTMALPFLGYLAARRRWAALAVAVSGHAAALAVVSSRLGIAPARLVREWLARARGQQAAGLIDLPSVAERLWPGAEAMALPTALIVLAAGVAVLVACRRRSDLALVSAACFLAAIFIYHRPYDLVLLIPAFALVIDSDQATGDRIRPLRLLTPILFAVLLIAPSHRAIIAERAYDALFIPTAYLFFALTLAALVHAPVRKRSSTESV